MISMKLTCASVHLVQQGLRLKTDKQTVHIFIIHI